jgi:hypothetical protein
MNDISSNAVAMTLILTYLFLTLSMSWIYGWMTLNTIYNWISHCLNFDGSVACMCHSFCSGFHSLDH